ncbi:MAG: ATP-grasp domain-containing protein [Treponema sp.]|jgi:D-alanine-D-alanine ligase-like ATP-grasp enzyme|nr:ATP-grasp domain-containing protein [Treponema sp.]
MSLVLYSTNTSTFDNYAYEFTTIPLRKEILEKFSNDINEEIIIVAVKPANFVLDIDENGNLLKAKNIIYDIIDAVDTDLIVNKILSYKPNMAIAFSSWTKPFDWISINDSLIGEKLKENGIKTVCHPLETSDICFDKNKTNDFLVKNNFLTPKSIYINSILYNIDKPHPEIGKNVYKELIHQKLDKMNYPLIIKDLYGLSSYGMEFAVSKKQVIHYLSLKKNNSDKIIEEYISGKHFGVELYGSYDCDFFQIPKLQYKIMDPFIFSINKYGITSPKQSIKIGPINDEKYKIVELKKELNRLALELKFCGVAQVDLIFSKDKWYFIEINSRLSGMTYTYETLFNSNMNNLFNINKKSDGYIINFKSIPLSQQKIERISKYESVLFVQNVLNKEAKSEREIGYTEIILGKTKSLSELSILLEEFNLAFPTVINSNFMNQAKSLLENI